MGKVELFAWAVIESETEGFWYGCKGTNHVGQLSIYNTKRNALKHKAGFDKVIKVKVTNIKETYV